MSDVPFFAPSKSLPSLPHSVPGKLACMEDTSPDFSAGRLPEWSAVRDGRAGGRWDGSLPAVSPGLAGLSSCQGLSVHPILTNISSPLIPAHSAPFLAGSLSLPTPLHESLHEAVLQVPAAPHVRGVCFLPDPGCYRFEINMTKC